MEALIVGSKLFVHKYRDKDSIFLGFRTHQNQPFFKPSNLQFPLNPISFPRQILIQPKLLVFALPLSSSSLVTPQVEVEKDELQLGEMQISDNQTKTVHVKFQLEKECSFGQVFHIVGDDPMFGLWDPENSVPMNWSDGHVWSAELDIPVGKSIKFKFLMKQGTETVTWQPGPDRVFEAWESEKTITICEDWENAESQKIIEGIPLSYDQLENNQERLIDAEYFVADPPIILENAAEIKNPEIEDQKYVVQDLVLVDIDRAVDIKSFSSLSSEPKSLLDEGEGVPVLVPGLTLPTEHVEEELKIEAEKDAPIGAEKAADQFLPELDLKEEHGNNTRNVQERAEVFNDNKQLYENEQQEMQQLSSVQDGFSANLLHVFSDDIQWARRTLDKFLKSFGIP